MGEHITLQASDGFRLSAWRADPVGTPRGGIVVIQEIMGVNHHIRAVADLYASHGYLAIAPALFDRVRRDVVLGYSAAEVEQAKGYRLQIPLSKALLDIAAAAAVVVRVVARVAARVAAVAPVPVRARARQT